MQEGLSQYKQGYNDGFKNGILSGNIEIARWLIKKKKNQMNYFLLNELQNLVGYFSKEKENLSLGVKFHD